LTFQSLPQIVVLAKACEKSYHAGSSFKSLSGQTSQPKSQNRLAGARSASDPKDEHFGDLPVSVNASKDGIFFTSRRKSYYKGMRVFVTFPFSSLHNPMNCEYVAEVVRVEELPNGKFGVAVNLKMSMNYSG